jgi:hypothetical protein
MISWKYGMDVMGERKEEKMVKERRGVPCEDTMRHLTRKRKRKE